MLGGLTSLPPVHWPHCRTTQCGAELGYADLVLSRCQSRLAVIKGLPDYQLSIWDWEAETVEVEHQLGEAFTGNDGGILLGRTTMLCPL